MRIGRERDKEKEKGKGERETGRERPYIELISKESRRYLLEWITRRKHVWALSSESAKLPAERKTNPSTACSLPVFKIFNSANISWEPRGLWRALDADPGILSKWICSYISKELEAAEEAIIKELLHRTEARVDPTASQKKWASEQGRLLRPGLRVRKFLFSRPHGSENQASLTLRWKCGHEGPMMQTHAGLHGSTGSCSLDDLESPRFSSTHRAPWLCSQNKWSYAGPSVTCSLHVVLFSPSGKRPEFHQVILPPVGRVGAVEA